MKSFLRILAKPVTVPVKVVKTGVDAVGDLAEMAKATLVGRKMWNSFEEATQSHERAKVDPMTKSLFLTKTFWANMLSMVIELFGLLPLPAGVNTIVTNIVNVLLRFFMTNEAVHVVKGEETMWAADEITKMWFHSWTFWWNVLVAVVDIANVLPIPPGYLTMINGVANIAIRLRTQGAVAFKKQ